MLLSKNEALEKERDDLKKQQNDDQVGVPQGFIGRKNSILNQGNFGGRNQRQGSIREKIVTQNAFFSEDVIKEEPEEDISPIQVQAP